jgi:tetratricopeptide (TPR) repeat protein
VLLIGLYFAIQVAWTAINVFSDLGNELSTSAAKSNFLWSIAQAVFRNWAWMLSYLLVGLLAWSFILLGEHRSLLREREALADARAASCVGELEVINALTRVRQERKVDRIGFLYSYFDAHPSVDARVNYLHHPELIGVPGPFWFLGFGYFLGVTFSALGTATRSLQVFLPSLATVRFESPAEWMGYLATNAPSLFFTSFAMLGAIIFTALLCIVVAVVRTAVSYQFVRTLDFRWISKQLTNSVCITIGVICGTVLNPFILNVMSLPSITTSVGNIELLMFPSVSIAYVGLFLLVTPAISWIVRGTRTSPISSVNWFFFLLVLILAYYFLFEIALVLVWRAPGVSIEGMLLLRGAMFLAVSLVVIVYAWRLRGLTASKFKHGMTLAPWLIRGTGSPSLNTTIPDLRPSPSVSWLGPAALGVVVTVALVALTALTAAKYTKTTQNRALWVQQQEKARALLTEGKYELAVSAYKQAVELAAIAYRDDRTAVTESNIARSYAGLGRAFAQQTHFSEATDAYKKSIEIRQSVLAAYPNIAEFQSDLAEDYWLIATAFRNQDRVDEAIKAFNDAARMKELALKKDPNNIVWNFRLSQLKTDFGRTLARGGNRADAFEAFMHSLSIIQQLNIKHKNVDAGQYLSWNDELVEVNRGVSQLKEDDGDIQQAIGWLNNAISVGNDLIAQSSDPRRWDTLSYCYSELGRLQRKAGELDNALEAYRRSAQVLELLFNQNRGNAKVRRDLADSYSEVGSTLLKQGSFPGALEEFGKALSLNELEYESSPLNSRSQSRLARSHVDVGAAAKSINALSDSILSLKWGIEIK